MPFERWSLLHLSILAATGLAAWACIRAARRDVSQGRRIARILAVVQAGNTILYMGYRIAAGQWDARYDLPMEFCNWSLVFSIAALLSQNRIMAATSYYWILSGSLQGVITPDLAVSFPHVYFFVFFINHSGLVIIAMFLVFGLGLRPGPGSVLWSFVFLVAYTVCASLVNVMLDANYGYLKNKPAAGSLMDYLGPWPWYIVSLHLIALVLFSILYLPFRKAEHAV